MVVVDGKVIHVERAFCTGIQKEEKGDGNGNLGMGRGKTLPVLNNGNLLNMATPLVRCYEDGRIRPICDYLGDRNECLMGSEGQRAWCKYKKDA